MKLEPTWNKNESDVGEFNDLFYNDKKPSFCKKLFWWCYP